ncbi:hypothetical protein HMPREF9449_02182 [Odoribacter laneus YIT 12061]|uniref:Uncharacterized protein n=1 Tax=Odoribacter laneus YIT 12061 TaxID=742817 RepID=H1DIF3_9BACT|nr:hypothetical protein HMPREF9449_02182 [Odoribacter laneus YIT 12061]
MLDLELLSHQRYLFHLMIFHVGMQEVTGECIVCILKKKFQFIMNGTILFLFGPYMDRLQFYLGSKLL